MTDASYTATAHIQTGGQFRLLPENLLCAWRWAFGVDRAYRRGGMTSLDAAVIDRIER